jgi:hypothetical protein
MTNSKAMEVSGLWSSFSRRRKRELAAQTRPCRKRFIGAGRRRGKPREQVPQVGPGLDRVRFATGHQRVQNRRRPAAAKNKQFFPEAYCTGPRLPQKRLSFPFSFQVCQSTSDSSWRNGTEAVPYLLNSELPIVAAPWRARVRRAGAWSAHPNHRPAATPAAGARPGAMVSGPKTCFPCLAR